MGEKYQRLILPAEVESQTGLSKRQLRRMVAEGRFPKPYKLASQTTVWDAQAVETFLAQQKGG